MPACPLIPWISSRGLVMVLSQMIAYKEDLIRRKSAKISKYKNSLSPSKKSLYQALNKEKTAFICEIKPSSPSQGVIRKEVDIIQVADIYAPFADAISVLADEKFFNGSLANVQKVSDRVRCPVLCKDVVVSPLQIYEARFYGADAVLLMLSVLDDETYLACARA